MEDTETQPEEEKTSEEATPEETRDASNQAETDLDRADRINKESRAIDKKREELLIREEKLEASRRVGGTGGGAVKVKVKEDTPEEYVKKVMKGEVGDAKG